MALQIISADPQRQKTTVALEDFLEVSEFYCDTIQGEGITTGVPAAFLRLQNCTLNCRWCDSRSVWRHGNRFTFNELFELMDNADLPRKLHEGQHLILTGGSPLMQQDKLAAFLNEFVKIYDFKPFIEVENECIILPTHLKFDYVNIWNNSPKLSNSGSPYYRRYKPEVIKTMSNLPNAWFKFVVYENYDWDEIKKDFLGPELIRRDQIILMPRGETFEELKKNQSFVVRTAIENNVRYCTREHIVLWDTTTGM